jgi:hypothetical protein
MLKKTITYEDFNGETVSEDFFFHLSKAELVELEMSHLGGLSESLQKIIDAEDNKQIIAEFKNIILTAYGKRSSDGRRFTKNQELRDEFISTEAYSALFMELVTDTDAAIEFINGIIPAGMTEEAAKAAGIDPKTTPLIVVEDKDKPEPKIITRKDILEMPAEEVEKLGERLASGEVRLETESQ